MLSSAAAEVTETWYHTTACTHTEEQPDDRLSA